jgi:hypothetical protein
MVNDSEKGELAWWLDAHRRYFARQAAREWFELDDDILTVFERFEVVEREATGAAPLWGSRSMSVTTRRRGNGGAGRPGVGPDRCARRDAGGGRGRPMDTKASTLDPVLLQLVVNMDLFGTAYIRATRSPRS